MSSQALPDFQNPLVAAHCQILAPFEGRGPHVLAPDRLEVAQRGDGRPDFSLEIVRGRNPFLPPSPSGILDMRVRAHYPTDEALRLLRDQHPDRTVVHAPLGSGFLRFGMVGGAGVPTGFLTPISLAWNGIGIGRWISRLSMEGVTFLKSALQGGVLMLTAAAEVELLGVSPRLPLGVRFDPSALLGALLALGDDQRRVAWTSITEFFRGDLSSRPLEIIGDPDSVDREQLAQALADRVRARFGALTAAPRQDAAAYMILPPPEAIGSGRFEWHLSEPVHVARVLVLELDPLSSARELMAKCGLESMVHETIVPPIPTGVLPVRITANLPEHRIGLLALGVQLRAPPRPPHRVQAISASVELNPPEDVGGVRLRLSLAEPPEYTYSTFALVWGASGIRRLDAPARPHSGSRLDLSPDAFPVTFVLIGAGRALLLQAVVEGVCRYSDGTTSVNQPFQLGLGQPALALALPFETVDATLEFEARALDGSGSLQLGPLPAEDVNLDLQSFPEYGPHEIEIACSFDDDRPFVAIDLLPDGAPDTPDSITVLHFTLAQPTRTWRWMAVSPFQASYRYRPHQTPDVSSTPWSTPSQPFERLELSSSSMGGPADDDLSPTLLESADNADVEQFG